MCMIPMKANMTVQHHHSDVTRNAALRFAKTLALHSSILAG